MKTISRIFLITSLVIGTSLPVHAADGLPGCRGAKSSQALVGLAVGAAATYGFWYYYQASRVAEAVRRAEAYLRIAESPISTNILNWRSTGQDAFPTVVSINTHVVDVNDRLAQDCTLFHERFCQAHLVSCNVGGIDRVDYGNAIRQAIQYELRKIQDILNFCDQTKELTWIMSDMIRPQLNERLYYQLTLQDQLDTIENAVTTYINRLGIPGGRWYESPGNFVRWVGGMFSGNPFWMPTRVCRAFMFPYEGRVAGLYWRLYKLQQRLFALRTAIGNNRILAAPAHAIMAQSQHMGRQACDSRYCPHRDHNHN